MNPKKLLLLWGSSGVYGRNKLGKFTPYLEVLELIEEEARSHGFEPLLVRYPGHPDREGVSEGKLSFDSALSKVLDECRKVKPDWIIGRSLGGLLAPAALSISEPWVEKCQGAVMWGPGFKAQMNAEWPTPEKKAHSIELYREFGTELAPDYFDTLPDVEALVVAAACNLRFARGSRDKYNCTDDLRTLESTHSRSQPRFKREVVVITGLDHSPTRQKLNPDQLKLYTSCLFSDWFPLTSRTT